MRLLPVIDWLPVVLTALAAVRDLQTGKIPNRLIAAGLAAGLVLRTLFEGPAGLASAIPGALLPLLLLFPLFYLRMQGAGDIKLLAMTGCYLGPAGGLKCLCLSYLIGGVFALCLLIRRKNFRSRFTHLAQYLAASSAGNRPRSYRAFCGDDGSFCFSVPILLSLLLITAGGKWI